MNDYTISTPCATGCGDDTAGSSKVCEGCETATRTALAILPDLYDALLDPPKVGGTGGRVTGTTEKPAPLAYNDKRTAPGDVRGEILKALQSITLLTVNERDVLAPRVALQELIDSAQRDVARTMIAAMDATEPDTASQFLHEMLAAEERVKSLTKELDNVNELLLYRDFVSRHLSWLLERDQAAEVVKRLTAVAKRAEAICKPVKKSGTFIGHCPVIVEGVSCGERLVGQPPYKEVTCTRCQTTGSVMWWRTALLAGSTDDLQPAAVISTWLSGEYLREINEGTIRQWANRGKIIRRGLDPKGRVLFSLSQVTLYAQSLYQEAA